MLYSLRGELIYSEPGVAVVDCGGVGFRCHISLYTMQALPKPGEEIRLFVHMAVKEDAITLYGFFDTAELENFKKLTTVKGVGAKVALAILSELPPQKLALAISSGDARAISKGQGVGPKLASRILLELKDQFGFTTDDGVSIAPMSDAGAPTARGEAMGALIALGYSQSEAALALAKCPDGLTVEEMIRQALKGLSARM